MTDQTSAAAASLANAHEYTVSALSGAIKRALEDEFGFVRVKGELGRVTRAGSGHLYLDLKDDKAVLSGVVWKGNAQRLKIAPEQGMEVVATGRVSTFPGQSRYQLIIDSLEPAGVGALMALLEERKKKLAAEGLFDQSRKRDLPFLPEVIGVVTSPSGAVIRDILHRLRDRFPRRVLVWPTLVQGKGADRTIAAAIRGFNALPEDGAVPRPDVLIVARGGGSLEDLWCFNEEIVVRAAADSDIPLISAVGHETDTTLIDYAADQRAPTPTAAAEMAVPVRAELIGEVLNKARRLVAGEMRLLDAARSELRAADRGLGRPGDLLSTPMQRLDAATIRLTAGLEARAAASRARLAVARLSPEMLFRQRRDGAAELQRKWERLRVAAGHAARRREDRLAAGAGLLAALSPTSVLGRGFALVRDAEGRILRSVRDGGDGDPISIIFDDGARAAVLGDAAPVAEKKPRAPSKTSTPRKSAGRPEQKSLFEE